MIAIWSSLPLDSLSERTEVEDGVMLRLAGLMRANGGFLKYLDVYNGEIDEDNADDIMRVLENQAPAVLVSTSTGRYDEMNVSATAATNVVTIDILAVSATLRGHAFRTRGEVATSASDVVDYGDPGIYFTMAAIRRALMGRRLGIEGAGTVRPRSEQMLYSIQNYTAWRAVYSIPVRIAQAREDALDEPPIVDLLHEHLNRDEMSGVDISVAVGLATPAPD